MTAPDQDRREHDRRDQSMREQNHPGQAPDAREPRAGQGAKAPPKPFTIEEGHRKVRSFVLRRAAGKSVFEEFQRVATRRPSSLAGCDLRCGDD